MSSVPPIHVNGVHWEYTDPRAAPRFPCGEGPGAASGRKGGQESEEGLWYLPWSYVMYSRGVASSLVTY